jgi:ankyrin repeat protein
MKLPLSLKAYVTHVCLQDGSTALICACEENNFSTVKLLLDNGASINATTTV